MSYKSKEIHQAGSNSPSSQLPGQGKKAVGLREDEPQGSAEGQRASPICLLITRENFCGMSLHPQTPNQIPPDTFRVAVAVFPKGNIYIRMRDELGAIYTDEAFAPLFPVQGKPALAPACLALITIMQFVEGLTDRQAADAVRSRIDW